MDFEELSSAVEIAVLTVSFSPLTKMHLSRFKLHNFVSKWI